MRRVESRHNSSLVAHQLLFLQRTCVVTWTKDGEGLGDSAPSGECCRIPITVYPAVPRRHRRTTHPRRLMNQRNRRIQFRRVSSFENRLPERKSSPLRLDRTPRTFSYSPECSWCMNPDLCATQTQYCNIVETTLIFHCHPPAFCPRRAGACPLHPGQRSIQESLPVSKSG